VLEAQGRELGDVCGPDLVSLGAELVDRRIYVDRVRFRLRRGDLLLADTAARGITRQ